jgi:hypothetical protein
MRAFDTTESALSCSEQKKRGEYEQGGKNFQAAAEQNCCYALNPNAIG